MFRLRRVTSGYLWLSITGLLGFPGQAYSQSAEQDQGVAAIINHQRDERDIPAILLYSQKREESAVKKNNHAVASIVDANSAKLKLLQSELKVKTARVDALEQVTKEQAGAAETIAGLRSKLSDVSQQLVEKEKRNEDTLSGQEGVQRKLSEANRQLELAGEDVKRINSLLVEKTQKLQERDSELAELKRQESEVSEREKASILRQNLMQKTLDMQKDLLGTRDAQTAERNSQIEQLTVRVSTLQKDANQIQDLQHQLSGQKQNLDDLTQKLQVADSTGNEQKQKMAQLVAESANKESMIKQLQAAANRLDNPSIVESNERRAYAVGVSLGEEMLKGLETRKQQGMPLPITQVVAGIRDTFSSRMRLGSSALSQELSEDAKALKINVSKLKAETIKEGSHYREQFMAQKGVISEDGIAIKILNKGKGTFSPDDTVSVVMKESLPNGVVTVDMAASKNVWAQKLEAYPSVFYGALERVGDGGHIIIVVPPEKAYGDNGLPPNIPPGATVIYDIIASKKGFVE